MNEQDAREFIKRVFGSDKVVKFEEKKYPNWPHYPYFNVEFDDNTKIELYEASATWFKVSRYEEDMASYSSLWREFSFYQKFKRGEVNEEVFKAYIKAIVADMEFTMESEIDARLTEAFSETFGVFSEELLVMDKEYFDYIRDKAKTEEEFNAVNEEIAKTINEQLTKAKKLLDNYLDSKVEITINEQGESVYNFDEDNQDVYDCLKYVLGDLDETKRYHIYLTDQKEEQVRSSENL